MKTREKGQERHQMVIHNNVDEYLVQELLSVTITNIIKFIHDCLT